MEEKKKKRLIVGIIIFIIIIAIIAAILLFGGHKKVTVTFDSDGGSAIAAVELEKGETVSKPTDPVKEGSDFEGWYLGDSAYNFSQPVSNSITLKAHWKESFYVTFLVNGEEYDRQKIVDNHVKFPTPPVLENLAFAGWLDENSNKIDENMVFTRNTVLKAEYVKNVPLKSLKFAKSSIDVKKGETVKPELKVDPADYTENIIFTSADSKIATVDDSGNITGVAVGKTTVTATYGKGKTTITVNVTNPPTGIDVASELTIDAGEKVNLNAKLIPSDATGKLSYSCDDITIATVDADGNVYGKEGGHCVITVQTDNKISKKVDVYVNEVALLVELVGNKPNGEHYLYYRANNRPVYNVNAELRVTEKGVDKYITVTPSDLTLNNAPDYIAFWGSRNELYATNHVLGSQSADKLLRTTKYTVYFSCKYNGKTVRSGDIEITVEPCLELAVTGGNATYNEALNQIDLPAVSGNIEFQLRLNMAVNYTASSNLTVVSTSSPTPSSGQPAYTYITLRYYKTSSSSPASITFTTTAGQKLEIKAIR